MPWDTLAQPNTSPQLGAGSWEPGLSPAFATAPLHVGNLGPFQGQSGNQLIQMKTALCFVSSFIK